MVEKINPYIAGAPVLEKRMFFGREDVFSWIERSLSGKFVNHILVIHGQRRVGKTSVLKHLDERLPEKYLPIFIDLQGRVNTTLPRFLWWLAREITRTLDMPDPDRKRFESDPEYFESGFLPEVEERLGDRVLLLTFDEFDTLESASAQESLALPFLAILKHLMSHDKLNFVFSIGSSGRKLENMQAAYTGFFKQSLYRKISFLGENEARELVTQPVAGIVQYDLDAVDYIYDLTSGHPYFIQLICHELFSVCQKLDRWQVTKADVENVLDAVIERGTVNLKFVWDEASELEKWVLASLANFEKGADLSTLDKFLKRQKVRFIRQDLESAILHLREKDVLASGNHFVIYLLKLWLIQNRSIEQVREELDKINPIVSRLLQVGYEYLDQGAPEKAIAIFQEALQSEEDNYEVRMGLAGAYRAREDFGRAAAEYEELLLLFPEDVAAQSGYCGAYLALGDHRFAMGRLDEAEFAYQQVLRVSPRHADGCRQMARLYQNRAVSAISGAEKTALDQARKALEYTPNDMDLQASVRDLEGLVAGERGIKDVLLAWGQRASENRYWQDAAGLLEAYQRLLGKDEIAPPALDKIRQRAQEEQMDSLRSHAERMERLGEYDEAIYALNKYLSLKPEDAEQIPLRIKVLKEARRRVQVKGGREGGKPFWIRPLVWIGVVLVAALALFVVLPGSPFAKLISGPASSPAADVASISPTSIAASEQENPQVSSDVSNPAPSLSGGAVVEANSWEESVLAVVAHQSPDFADDFSSVNPDWHSITDEQFCSNLDEGKMNITGGAMNISVGPNCPLQLILLPFISYSDYILQMDINFQQTDSVFEFSWLPSDPTEVQKEFSFLFKRDVWGLDVVDPITGGSERIYEGRTGFDDLKSVTFTIVNRGKTYLFYLDSVLVTSYTNPGEYKGTSNIRLSGSNFADTLTEIETLKVDNFKVWDLDNLINPESVLEAIAVQSPYFADDFSQVDPAWYADIDEQYCSDRDAAKISITDGVMRRSVTPDCPFSWVSHPDLPYRDYVMQLDIAFPQTDMRWAMNTWPLNPGAEPYQTFNFILSKYDWHFERWDSTTGDSVNGPVGNTEVDYRKPITLTIINRGTTYLYYLNSKFLTSFEDTAPSNGAQEMRFMVENWTDSLTDIETLEMDNVKVWNMDGLVLPEPILTAIRNQPPDFSDDFSQVDPHWEHTPHVLHTDEICSNTDGAQMIISEGSMKCGVDPNCRQGIIYHPAMQAYGNYVVQADIKFNQTLGTLEFRTFYPFGNGLGFNLTSFGSWILFTEEAGNSNDKIDGRIEFDTSEPVTLTIININSTVFYYANSSLLISYALPETYDGPVNMDFNLFSESASLSQGEAFELDNVKIWNLDRIGQ